ncbi:MAG TPA: hypothetical protein VFQ61_07105 [Polyangiaceae bacterium]|nr:hypothetical protein [Polyangiaceae bacterium]
MKFAFVTGICVVLFQAAACSDAISQTSGAGATGSDADVSSAQSPLISQNIAAMQIFAAGHGQLFDSKQQRIPADLQFVEQVQASVRTAALDSLGGQLSAELQSFMREADTLLSRQAVPSADKLVLKGGMAWRILQDAPGDVSAELEWRLEAVNAQIFSLTPVKVNALYGDFLKRIGYWDYDARFGPLRLSYGKVCDLNQVPVPPDWAETGTAWVHVGRLTHNILDTEGEADVYTYTDPVKRGACIALPRDGGLLGIICQSASTGKACFWDNIPRDGSSRIPWKGATLRIGNLKNGADLTENCTNCHTGNNVFLTSPDDPVWAKLLRGPTTVDHPRNFTLRVEASDDNRGGRPRYAPITGKPRPSWTNPYNSSTTCNTCHEAPKTELLGLMNPPPMPPACGSACVTR